MGTVTHIQQSSTAVQSEVSVSINRTKMLRARSKSYSQQKQWKQQSLDTKLKTDEDRQYQNISFAVPMKEITPGSLSEGSSTIAHAPEDCNTNSKASCTCLTSTNILPITVITILYFIFLPTTFSAVDGASSPLGDACGIYVRADELPLRGPLHGIEKSRALCELHGNLSKQIVSLRRFMGPRNFLKVWGKHNNSYAFLKVANEKNITLRTWHKQLQVYVAMADRLYERALNYKTLQQSTWISSKEHINKADKDLQRLRHLIIITRSILCDLELTATLLAKHQISKKTFTSDAAIMRAKILIKSDKRTATEGVNPIDINMLYQRLRRSLVQMRKPLRRHCIRSKKRAKQERKLLRKTKKYMNKEPQVSKVGEMDKNRGVKNKMGEERVKTRHKRRHQQSHSIRQFYT